MNAAQRFAATPAPLHPDIDQARRFLAMIDQDGPHCFQTFADSPGSTAKPFHVHGTLDQHAARLTMANQAGAGAFVVVNQTDGRGRKSSNVTRVRALFIDLDGSPLEPVCTCSLPFSIIVESSPGRYHCYWLVSDAALDQFSDLQKQLAARFNGDPKVHDLPRVMRLPGFWHQKRTPFQSRMIHPAGAV